MRKLTKFFRDDERGATAIEYAIIAGLLSILIVTGVSAVGTAIVGNFYGPIGGALS